MYPVESIAVLPQDFLVAVADEQKLSSAERQAFLLAVSSDKSIDEMAEELGTSSTALRVRLSAVYKKFDIDKSGPGKLTELKHDLELRYKVFVKERLERIEAVELGSVEPALQELGYRILQNSSLDWAIKHALNFGNIDFFPLSFEYEAIRYDWLNVRQYLSTQNLLNWQVRPRRVFLAPKPKYGFRAITQLDPLDFLIFAALVKELGEDIESKRVPIEQKIVFSYRYSPNADGRLYNREFRYPQFVAQAQAIIAENPKFAYVVATDIVDFYYRISLEQLNNVLNNATSLSTQVKALMHLLTGWNGTDNLGLPVGNTPSHLLAEITLSDVDEALLANGIKFIRYVDDYRIFATSYAEAYRHLSFLADVLYRNHGLTLQANKTYIQPAQEFIEKSLQTLESRELKSLKERFRAFVRNLRAPNEYENINYDKLTPTEKKSLASLNLIELFHKELNPNEETDLKVVKYILSRLERLGDTSLVDDVLKTDNLVMLLPVLPVIIRYLHSLKNKLAGEYKVSIGANLLALVQDSIISDLEYYCMWALELFTRSTEWGNEDKFISLLAFARESTSRRQLILAMGRAKQQHWFHSQLNRLFDESPWSRRAFLAGASCLPPEVRNHWYKSIEPRLDPLEKAVVRWATANPFANN